MFSTRRSFMEGMAALAVGAAIPKSVSAIQTPVRPYRIDTHSHFTIPKLYPLVTATRGEQPTLKDWSPERCLEQMAQASVATSIISISDPGIFFGDKEAARALARECNDFGAKVVRDYPGRFGLFAVLPLPDVEGALREVAYAFDTLKADGIGILSSYQGKYLGNPAFTPLMEELNRRKIVVFCHPYCPACDAPTPLDDAQNRGFEFVFDTSRTILSLLNTGTVTRFPDIRFIWSHGGGTIPYITSRFGPPGRPSPPQDVMYELQKFYYDTALAFNAYTLPSLKKMVPASHLLFGTDYPLGGTPAIVAKGLADNGGFTAAEMRGIDRDNALELIPRLKT